MTSLASRRTAGFLPAPVVPDDATTTMSEESIMACSIAGAAANEIAVA